MNPLTTMTVLAAVSGFINLMLGFVLLDIRNRLKHLEEMIGNGRPGVFVRRDELVLMREKADDEHDEFRRRLGALEKK